MSSDHVLPPQSKLNKERMMRIANAIEAGSCFKHAILGSGIGYHTGREWYRQGQMDNELNNPTPERDFYLLVIDAEAKLEQRLTAKWVKSLQDEPDGWKGIAAYLEKRFRDDWGKAPMEVQAQVMDLRKNPEFHKIVRMISTLLPPEKQIEFSEMLENMPDDGI